ncbi:MAG: 2Fe-2S iron-sulfur cluster binding domain-containing protein [Propionibacteriales bacterium]|nr:2Fe-2S iron-sulfur cluster binding domain-containing protein [Propionibacteriales bacterium]
MTDQTAPSGQVDVRLIVNGDAHTVAVDVDETLLDTLRDRFDVTSARGTCGIGLCGACTVLVDSKVVSSCIMLTAQAAGHEITTAESLGGGDGRLARVQEAFVQRGAYQCSFCIPAMALTVHAALADDEAGRSRDSVREYLAGNLCRCGTYPEILEAVTDLVDEAGDRATGSDA